MQSAHLHVKLMFGPKKTEDVLNTQSAEMSGNFAASGSIDTVRLCCTLMSEDQVRQKCMFVFAVSHVFLKDLTLTTDDLAELDEFIVLLLGSHTETTMHVRAMFLSSTSFNHEHTTVLALLAC